MKAKIYISYKEGILDPQGTTVNNALDSIGINMHKEMKIIAKYFLVNLSIIVSSKWFS